MLTVRNIESWKTLPLVLALALGACVSSPNQRAPALEARAEVSRAAPDTSLALLAAAEKALAADRLMSPSHDNAYDRYKAVLILRPGNEQATSGLQQVFLRYLALTRSALAKARWRQAETYLARANIVSPNHSLVEALAFRLKEQRSAQVRADAPDNEVDAVFRLDATQVARRDPAILDQLRIIAERMKETGETMLIVSLSDVDGRWLYSQMKASVPGFRLRGDIRLGRKVKVVLRAPIDVPLKQ